MSTNQNELDIIDTSEEIGNYTLIYNNEILFERSSYYSKENTILMKDFTHNDFTLTICSVYEIVTFFTIGNYYISIMYS